MVIVMEIDMVSRARINLQIHHEACMSMYCNIARISAWMHVHAMDIDYIYTYAHALDLAYTCICTCQKLSQRTGRDASLNMP